MGPAFYQYVDQMTSRFGSEGIACGGPLRKRDCAFVARLQNITKTLKSSLSSPNVDGKKKKPKITINRRSIDKMLRQWPNRARDVESRCAVASGRQRVRKGRFGEVLGTYRKWVSKWDFFQGNGKAIAKNDVPKRGSEEHC